MGSKKRPQNRRDSHFPDQAQVKAELDQAFDKLFKSETVVNLVSEEAFDVIDSPSMTSEKVSLYRKGDTSSSLVESTGLSLPANVLKHTLVSSGVTSSPPLIPVEVSSLIVSPFILYIS